MSIRGSWDAWERDSEVPERFDAFSEYYDSRDARLKKLGKVIETWRQSGSEADRQKGQAKGGDYEEVGRLEARLEATRHELEEIRETGNWQELRDEVDQTISDLEEAIGRAAPRFQ